MVSTSRPDPSTGPAHASSHPGPGPTGKVLACIDESPYAGAVCDYAAWSAARMGAPLSLLHVLDVSPLGAVSGPRNLTGTIGFDAQEQLLEELAELDAQRSRLEMERGRHLLDAARVRAEPQVGGPVETRQRHGELVDAAMALETEIRMLVLGKRGTKSASAHGHLGGNLERVIQTLSVPILVAQQAFTPPERIMFAFDGSATARKGVRMVAASPLFAGIPCHLVHAGADLPETREALREAASILQGAGFQAPTAILPGSPADVLPRYQAQEGIDLLIMGAYGHSRIRRLFVGSTTRDMLRSRTVSVMVLR